MTWNVVIAPYARMRDNYCITAALTEEALHAHLHSSPLDGYPNRHWLYWVSYLHL